MKISKNYLKQVIKEELNRIINEAYGMPWTAYDSELPGYEPEKKGDTVEDVKRKYAQEALKRVSDAVNIPAIDKLLQKKDIYFDEKFSKNNLQAVKNKFQNFNTIENMPVKQLNGAKTPVLFNTKDDYDEGEYFYFDFSKYHPSKELLDSAKYYGDIITKKLKEIEELEKQEKSKTSKLFQ